MTDVMPEIPKGAIGFIPRQALGAERWNAYVDAHPEAWFWYRWEWLDYCLAYKQGSDQSFALLNERQEIVGVVPLIIEGPRFAMGGSPMVGACLTHCEHAHNSIARHVDNLALAHGVATGEMMYWVLTPEIPKDWPKGELEDCCTDTSFRRRVIDLRITETERWPTVRKSYHQLIRRAQDQHRLRTGAFTPGQKFSALHQDYYGHPRSPETYALQESWEPLGISRYYFSVSLERGTITGGAMWLCYKRIAYYAGGVYPQDNIAHFVLWESMNDLAKQGIIYADLGHQGRAKTKKEENIEFLKRGFGGEDWPVPCVQRVFLTERSEGAA